MHIIPVIDLMNGIVVHARYGRRQSYQAIQSILCESADPESVINGFLSIYPFDTIYLADLDSLCSAGNNTRTITWLLNRYPDLQFWIDQGILHNADSWLPANWKQVIGTESLTEATLASIALKQNNPVLSLDFKHSLIGAKQLLDCPDQWPDQVIVMTLNKVGSDSGPDLDVIARIQQMATHSCITAAGGIRGLDDLSRLSTQGIHSALVASALHTGQLSRDDIDHCHGMGQFHSSDCLLRTEKNRHTVNPV